MTCYERASTSILPAVKINNYHFYVSLDIVTGVPGILRNPVFYLNLDILLLYLKLRVCNRILVVHY